MKNKGYNRNLTNGNRPHRGISRSYKGINIQDLTLAQRLVFESKRLEDYHKRINL